MLSASIYLSGGDSKCFALIFYSEVGRILSVKKYQRGAGEGSAKGSYSWKKRGCLKVAKRDNRLLNDP